MNDDELEQTMRAGLERRALRADVDVAVADRARHAARGRRTTRLAVVGAAAAAVVAVAVTGVVVARDDRSPGAADDPATSTPTDRASTNPAPDGFRTEYWHDTQVDVPAHWGWGATPDACGGPPEGKPYVGRPIGNTDACGIAEPDATPTAPYVWFDAAGVEPGTVDLGDGWTRETVAADATMVSVATTDPALRARVVDSIGTGDLCSATLEGVPVPRFDWTHEGGGPFASARLCAYREGSLVYAEVVGRSTFEATLDAVAAAPEPSSCDYPTFETVVLTGVYDDPFGTQDLEHDVVYDLSCGVARIGGPLGAGPTAHQLTEATVPWAGRQFRHLLTGPISGGDWVYGRFIGVQG